MKFCFTWDSFIFEHRGHPVLLELGPVKNPEDCPYESDRPISVVQLSDRRVETGFGDDFILPHMRF